MIASLKGMYAPAARDSPPMGLSLRGPAALLSVRFSRARLLGMRAAISSRELRLAGLCGSLHVKRANAVCCPVTRQMLPKPVAAWQECSQSS